MYTACMFDLDGTLANTLNSIAYFGNTALSKFGFSPIETENYKMLVGNGADMLVKRMLKTSVGDFTDEIFRAVRSEYDRLYESSPMHLVMAYDGINEMLRELKQRGVKIAVLSNKPDNMTYEVVKNLFGTQYFNVIRGQIDGIPKKPDPTAPLNILTQMKVSAADCLYIGDSGVDMETGKNAGMDTAGVLWGFRSKEELIGGGAKYIVSNTDEIITLIK